MEKIKALLLIALALAAVSLTRAGDNDAARNDLERLQGEWAMVSGKTDGMTIPNEMVSGARRVCRGDELTVFMGQTLIMKTKISLDPTKTPRTIDYELLDGANKGKTQLGIYELDGDTLKACFGAPGSDRPADFACIPGDKRTSTIWKRVKAVAEPEKK